MQYGYKLVPVTIIDVSLRLVTSKLGLPICYLFPAMYAISRCDSISSFSQTGNMTTFQTLKKQTEPTQTDRYDRLRWISFILLWKSACCNSIKYVCYLYDDNKSASSVNELWCRMFPQKNSSIYHLPPTLDVLDWWF